MLRLDELAPIVLVVRDLHAGNERQRLGHGIGAVAVLLLRRHLHDAAAMNFHRLRAFHPSLVLAGRLAEKAE